MLFFNPYGPTDGAHEFGCHDDSLPDSRHRSPGRNAQGTGTTGAVMRGVQAGKVARRVRPGS
jgi:hypothetical protein